jgi:precorrin-8X/cobalt-precorrin-8 methylmutase
VPLFDSYLMVDWSAANAPARGRDSIWLCHLVRDGGQVVEAALENPPTRRLARERLAAILQEELARGRAALAGFDFPFGYPAGFAGRLDPRRPCWQAVWRIIARGLQDDPQNASNRFEVAAQLNARSTGIAAPFWGHPAGRR